MRTVCIVLQARGQLSTSTLGLVLLYAGSLQRAMMDLLMRLTQIEVGFVANPNPNPYPNPNPNSAGNPTPDPSPNLIPSPNASLTTATLYYATPTRSSSCLLSALQNSPGSMTTTTCSCTHPHRRHPPHQPPQPQLPPPPPPPP